MPTSYVPVPIPPGPMVHGVNVTTGSAVNFTTATRGLLVMTAGSLTFTMNGDTTPVTLTSIPVGWYPWSIASIAAGGTAVVAAFW